MKITGRRAAVAVAALALFAVSLSACGSSPAPEPAQSQAQSTDEPQSMDQLVADAKAEGQLTLYGDAGEPTLQAWTKAFTEEYGIAVNILRLPESELFQRFTQEKAAGQNLADIYSTTNRVSMDKNVASDYIAEYAPKDGELYPAEYRKDGYYYPVQNGYFMAVAYNTDLLDEDDIEFLRKDPFAAAGDKRFEGRVVVGPPQASQHAAAYYYLQTDDQKDWDTLQAMADNGAVVNPQSLPLLQSVVAGEYAIGFAISDTLIAQQVMAGAPIEFVYPVDTTGGFFNTGVVQDAPHPNAARLFMEWAATPEANALYSQITQAVPTNSEVTDDREITDMKWYEAPNTDDVWFDWITDKTFLTASGADGDFLDHWSKVFGYNG